MNRNAWNRAPLLIIGIALTLTSLGCPTPEPPPARGVQVGTVVGEVLVADPTLRSVGGAAVEIYGTPAKATTEEGKNFVLPAIPLGTHKLLITHAALGRSKVVDVSVGAAFQTVIVAEDDATLGEPASVSGTVTLGDGGSTAGAFAYLVGGSGLQQAPVGDDGTYGLTGLPIGSVQIAIAKVGYDMSIIDLDVGEGDNAAPAVALQGVSAGDLCISSTVRRVEETDHRGINVLLNGGEQVTATDANGTYRFCDLSPGVYAVKAQAPGFKSMELAQVALNADGDAFGLVPAYVSPGNDEVDVNVDLNVRGLAVEISNPVSGAVFEEGQAVTLIASAVDQGAALDGSTIRWTRQQTDATPLPDPIVIGNGDLQSVASLPVGEHRIQAIATAPDGVASAPDDVLITVLPFDYGLDGTISFRYETGFVDAYDSVPFTLAGENLTARVDQLYSYSVEDVAWAWRTAGDTAATPTPLGTGAVLQDVQLSEGFYDILMTLSTDGGAGTRTIVALLEVETVVVVPNFDPGLSIFADFAQGAEDVRGFVRDANDNVTGVTVEMYQGQPVDTNLAILHPRDGNIATTAVWTSDTGILFDGASPDLRSVPAGTHVFTVVVTDASNVDYTLTITLEVLPFAFSASVISPRLEGEQVGALDAPPYFSEFGLPLRVAVNHSFQSAFSPGKVRWYRELTGGGVELIGSGLVSRTFLADPGQGVLRVEIEDENGNVATATTEYVLQQITFTTFLVQPLNNSSILEGDTITAAMSYTHTLVEPSLDPMDLDPGEIPEADLEVRYFSSIDGQLADGGGVSVFGVNDQPAFGGLTFGTHTITSSVRDGQGRVSTDERTVIVRSPSVVASLTSPQTDGLVLFPGVTDVSFVASVNSDNAVTPIYSWRFDGNEFPSTWDDYGTDDSDAARASINLGTFQPGTGPFDIVNWTEGPHAVEFFARLPEVDAQFGGACVNIPQKAVCLQFAVNVAGGQPDVCTAVTQRDIVGVETWSGVKRLNCDIDIEPGTQLIIEPGTRVVVESGRGWDIEVNGGSLVIGDPTGSNPAEVVFETQNITPGPNGWQGIYLDSELFTVDVNNTTFRHANRVFERAYYMFGGGPNAVVHLRDVTIETVNTGISGLCPNTLENVVIRDARDWAINETGTRANCDPVLRSYDGLVVEDSQRGVYLYGGGDVSATGVEMRRISEHGFYQADGTLAALDVRDSIFEEIGTNANSQAAINMANSCRRLLVTDTVFRNNASGIRQTGCGLTRNPVPRIDVVRSVFEGNQRGIYDTSTTDLPISVHLSSFQNNADDIYLDGEGQDFQAQGNYMGDEGDVLTAGGVAYATPPGAIPQFPNLRDFRDNSAVGRVIRFDNPLPAGASDPALLPSTFVRQPERTNRYHVTDGGCLPLEARAPDLATLDVAAIGTDPTATPPQAGNATDPDAFCAWYLLADAGDPDTGRTQVGVDSDGCMENADTLAPSGDNALVLECVLKASGVIEQHVAEFHVDNGAWQGALRRANTIWAGDIEVSGDIVVPPGQQLTVQAGATVTMRGGDALRYSRYPDLSGSADDSANDFFGSRAVIDIFVDGTLLVGESGGARATLQGEGTLQAAGSWGGIKVWRSASAVVTNATMSGGQSVMHGFYNADSTTAPNIEVDNTVMHDNNIGFRGVCPRSLDGITMSDGRKILWHTFCTQSLSITNSTFDAVGEPNQNTQLAYLDSYDDAGANLQLLLDNVHIDRTFGTRKQTLFDIDDSQFGSIIVRNSDFHDFDRLAVVDIWNSGFAFQIDIESTVATNFVALNTNYYGDRYNTIRIADSAFDGCSHIVGQYNNGDTVEVTGNRIQNCSEVFWDLRLGDSTRSLTFTGNHVEDVVRVFDVYANGTNGEVHSPVGTGNNFVNVTYAVDIASNNIPNQTVLIDLTGNWFGTTNTATIEAMIIDPQADAGANAVGMTDYSGFATTPLPLSVPTLP